MRCRQFHPMQPPGGACVEQFLPQWLDITQRGPDLVQRPTIHLLDHFGKNGILVGKK
jgi:hypothetical protein